MPTPADRLTSVKAQSSNNQQTKPTETCNIPQAQPEALQYSPRGNPNGYSIVDSAVWDCRPHCRCWHCAQGWSNSGTGTGTGSLGAGSCPGSHPVGIAGCCRGAAAAVGTAVGTAAAAADNTTAHIGHRVSRQPDTLTLPMYLHRSVLHSLLPSLKACRGCRANFAHMRRCTGTCIPPRAFLHREGKDSLL